MRRRDFLLALPSLALSGPCLAFDAPHLEEFRDRVASLYRMLEQISDDAPLAEARRMSILRQIEWVRDQYLDDTRRQSALRSLLEADPEGVVPQFSVPLDDQIALQHGRIGQGMHDVLRDGAADLSSLIDVAAGQAAVEKLLGPGIQMALRLAALAQIGGDETRRQILGATAYQMNRQAEEEAQARDTGSRARLRGLPYQFYAAGFVVEAEGFAQDFLSQDPYGSNAETVLCRLVSDTRLWRQGRIGTADVDGRARDGLAAVPEEERHFSSYANAGYQLVRFLNDASPDDRLPDWVNHMVEELDGLDPDRSPMRFRHAGLFLELGRMGRSDLARRLPYVGSDAYFAETGGLAQPDVTASLHVPMTVAAYQGDWATAEAFRQRLLRAIGNLPPLPDTTALERDSHILRHVLLAGLVEVAAERVRSGD